MSISEHSQCMCEGRVFHNLQNALFLSKYALPSTYAYPVTFGKVVTI